VSWAQERLVEETNHAAADGKQCERELKLTQDICILRFTMTLLSLSSFFCLIVRLFNDAVSTSSDTVELDGCEFTYGECEWVQNNDVVEVLKAKPFK
jgi:hypothetical protein